MTAFRSGATEGGLMNWLEVARARTNGDQVSAVVPFLEMPNVWIVPKSSAAKDMAGLKGMKIGTYNRFSPEWILFLATARDNAGYDPKVDSTVNPRRYQWRKLQRILDMPFPNHWRILGRNQIERSILTQQ